MTDQTVELARQLAQSIANEADADQWSISLVGLKGVSEGELEELLPPTWLQALNGGRAARYRMTLLLYACGRPIGTVRLATIRPSGFSDPEVRHARSMANRVGIMMADALDHCTAVESLARERNHPNGA
jgi:hypothetical protein